jgi:arabinogalactan endo-1,4-beta-galactosidase
MKIFNKIIFLLLLVLLSNCSKNTDAEPAKPITTNPIPVFYKGMDLSFQSELESYNLDYKDENNTPIQVLDFVKQKGCNLVRLKLWHTPQNNLNSLSVVKAYALKLKQRNIPFMLDIHYSDTWSDPANQTPPLAWQNLTLDDLKNQVYLYTKDVLTQLKNQGTSPDIVQIGNETDSGFLWNYGKVWNQFATNWGNYAALINKGILAVREVNGTATKIILHVSSVENASYFFAELANFNLDFDVIGLSYYPQFSTKDLNLVQTKLNYLATTFNKEIMLVEVAYPFTLNYQDNLNNYIGFSNQIIPAYPATADGQKNYMLRIIEIIKNIPNNKGIGFVYWAPDWIAFIGNATTSLQGSAWENQCLWDFNHKALPGFDVFAP